MNAYGHLCHESHIWVPPTLDPLPHVGPHWQGVPTRPGLGTRVVLGWDHYPDGVIMSPLNWPGAKGDVGSPLGGVSQEKVTNIQHEFFRLVF